MRLNNLFEDKPTFKSVEDVRRAGIEDLNKVNKAIEDSMKELGDIVKKVQKSNDTVEKFSNDLEKAEQADNVDINAINMIKHTIMTHKTQLSQLHKLHAMHLGALNKFRVQQVKLMKILQSGDSLNKVFSKLQSPGDLTKQAPVDTLLAQLNKSNTLPNTAGVDDIRGIGRQL